MLYIVNYSYSASKPQINSEMPSLRWIGEFTMISFGIFVQKNKIEMLNMTGAKHLVYLDASHNHLMSIHGLDGCSGLRHLDLSHNRITRVGKIAILLLLIAIAVYFSLCNWYAFLWLLNFLTFCFINILITAWFRQQCPAVYHAVNAVSLIDCLQES